ncbi:MAG: RES family NAD+ phosphorylase [Candidatus Omnitrophica bacterium]|nr:RES family NAD+ phosphorylase [Candidatus Omnitrophota bacterium]
MPEKKNSGEIEKRFLEIKPIPLDTSCYRVVSQKYDALNTNGSLLYPGRYNSGEFLVLYASDSREVCAAELARKAEIRTKFIYKIVKLKVKLRKVFDLTNEKNLKALDIQEDNLIGSSWNFTQALASLAYRKGYEALLVPSAAGKGNNIILFPGNFTKDSTIKKEEEEIV